MSQSINSSLSTNAGYQAGETITWPGTDKDTFTKTVTVLSSTDRIDLSPDARKALQALLAGTDGQTAAVGGNAKGASPTDDMQVSIAVTSARTTGYQQDYASASDDTVSWTAADGQTGTFEIEEKTVFTTNAELVPLSPALQASSQAPGLSVTKTTATLDDGPAGVSAATSTAHVMAGTELSESDRAALLVLKASATVSSRTNAPDKDAHRPAEPLSPQA